MLSFVPRPLEGVETTLSVGSEATWRLGFTVKSRLAIPAWPWARRSPCPDRSSRRGVRHSMHAGRGRRQRKLHVWSKARISLTDSIRG